MKSTSEALTIENDVDGIESVGQAAARVVKQAGQALALERKSDMAPIERREMTPMEMVGRALELGVGADILKQMMDLRDREEANQARKAFDNAMADARAEITPIIKNRTVGFESRKPGAASTNYRHEDLAQVARTIDPVLAKHGLSYRFRTTSAPNEPISVTCVVSHRLGHYEENTLIAGRDDSGNKNSIQQIGSTITYLQRYSLKAALGLAASNDDDGKAAGEMKEPEKINEAQLKRLRDLLDETGSDVAKFCELGNLDSLPDMLAADFDPAVRLLEAKKRKLAS